VFEGATVDTLLLTVRKENIGSRITNIKSIDRNIKTIQERLQAIQENQWNFNDSIDFKTEKNDLQISFRNSVRLAANKRLKDYFELKFGVKLYEVGKGLPPQKKADSQKRIYESKEKKDNTYQKLLKARNIKRYGIDWKESYVKYGNNLAAPRDPRIFKEDRILIQRIVSKASLDCTFLNEFMICNTDVITLLPKFDFNCKFYLAILNTRLIGNFIKSKNINLDRAAFPKINTNTLEELPVPDILKVDINIKKNILLFVDTILDLNKQKQTTTNSETLEQLNQRIAYTDAKINKLVYELYGLSEEEVGIVEGKGLILQ
jgi:adenine-specific DNA-methyltransferase